MMQNYEILNGLAAVESALDAFEELENQVPSKQELKENAEAVIEVLCRQNPALQNEECITNGSGEEQIPIGTRIMSGMPADMLPVLEKELPKLYKDGRLELPVFFDPAAPLLALITADEDISQESTLSQYILLETLKRKENLRIRCVDLVKVGSYFTMVHQLISDFPDLTTGHVVTQKQDFSRLIEQLEKESKKTVAALGGSYSSLSEYNKDNLVALNEYLNVFFLGKLDNNKEYIKLLHQLAEIRAKNGMSFILVGDEQLCDEFDDIADFRFRMEGDSPEIAGKAYRRLTLAPEVALKQSDVDELITSIQKGLTVDTLWANNPELHTEPLKLSAEKAIRIPFAIDRYGQPCYFEIGGEAPAHALISGSTGSGKSTALHSMITETIRNYHPDDVEVWAIDYKQVEFEYYYRFNTPHFRVIGQDTSEEFSLSLLDLLYKEYEDRKERFLTTGVKSIEQYRKKFGPRSMPRIVVFIDEFQILTQAAQNYTGETDYRTVLENLLKLTRAMGISFVFSSQTIASGLSGLSDGAREQIGCRLSLKHDTDTEIRETLVLSGEEATAMVNRVKQLTRGQGIYKRARWAKEPRPDGKAYELLNCYVLYQTDSEREAIIEDVNERLGDDFTPKKRLFVHGSGRIAVSERERHPIMQFIQGDYEADELPVWFPAAPTTLADSFGVELETSEGSNMILLGKDTDLRDAVLVNTVCGFLINPDTRVIASFIDSKSRASAKALSRIDSRRLTINIGVKETRKTIAKLKKLRPLSDEHRIYLWFGLDKLKLEIKNLEFEEEDEEQEEEAAAQEAPQSEWDLYNKALKELDDLLGGNDTEKSPSVKSKSKEKTAVKEDLSYDECADILSDLFEFGPDNGYFSLCFFESAKALKKSNVVQLSYFDHRVGMKMSADDSYDVFGSSMAASKADKDTVIYYSGSGKPISLHPYLIPDEDWFDEFNEALD